MPLSPSLAAELRDLGCPPQRLGPPLDRLGLEHRRVYQTRDTAAVLHLAAGGNPLFVSRLLGHLSTKMLFERYAPFVANALADDGSRSGRMMSGVQGRG